MNTTEQQPTIAWTSEKLHSLSKELELRVQGLTPSPTLDHIQDIACLLFHHDYANAMEAIKEHWEAIQQYPNIACWMLEEKLIDAAPVVEFVVENNTDGCDGVLSGLVDQLNRLQAKHNDGRGISCVKSAVVQLQRHDITSAKRIIATEWDKIRNYRDVAEWLQEKELAEKSWIITDYAVQ